MNPSSELRPNPAERFEQMVAQNAQRLAYPPTPDIAGAVAQRLSGQRTQRWRLPPRTRLAWLIALLLVITGLLATPQVRAAILEFIQIGAVRIWLIEPTPAPTATVQRSLLPLTGETTLERARQRAPWPVPLPTWPADLGQPDAVFWQDIGGDAVVLVWLDQANPSRVRLSLHLLSNEAVVWKKMAPAVVEETTVNGQRAFWTTGPYLLMVKGKGMDATRLIEGHVLIWTEGAVTYRLETDLSVTEAVQIAESLQ
jgi:hypothetical protein